MKDSDNKLYYCKIRGRLRLEGIKSTNPVAVGDYVDFDIEKEQNGVIVHLCKRKNYIIRKSTNLSKRSHIIAANIDEAFLIATIVLPETPVEFIDRFLLTAEAYGIKTTLLFNKTDVLNNNQRQQLEYLTNIYLGAGYEVMKISALKRTNTEALKQKMKDKINLLAGNSGVGKSTLINVLCPEAKRKVRDISETHLTGKHTTTFAEMIELDKGGYLIDTPGIKGFGLVNIKKEELHHFFPEIFKFSKKCFYYNCTHIHEPKCAVRQAVEEDMISESRYNSYYNIFQSDDNKHRI